MAVVGKHAGPSIHGCMVPCDTHILNEASKSRIQHNGQTYLVYVYSSVTLMSWHVAR
jgi:hypothetical protein